MLASASDADEEAALKQARNYGGEREAQTRALIAHEHFGLVVVSCERGDLRPMPDGVHVYDDEASRFEALPVPAIARKEVIDELLQAIASSRPALHDGTWGRATLQVCIAMLQSARENREVVLA